MHGVWLPGDRCHCRHNDTSHFCCLVANVGTNILIFSHPSGPNNGSQGYMSYCLLISGDSGRLRKGLHVKLKIFVDCVSQNVYTALTIGGMIIILVHLHSLLPKYYIDIKNHDRWTNSDFVAPCNHMNILNTIITPTFFWICLHPYLGARVLCCQLGIWIFVDLKFDYVDYKQLILGQLQHEATISKVEHKSHTDLISQLQVLRTSYALFTESIWWIIAVL